MFQQAGIPDNVAYLVLGMALLFGFLGAWLGSFFWRLRNLRRDIQLLEQIAAEDGPEA
jgi:cell division protein FtsX